MIAAACLLSSSDGVGCCPDSLSRCPFASAHPLEANHFASSRDTCVVYSLVLEKFEQVDTDKPSLSNPLLILRYEMPGIRAHVSRATEKTGRENDMLAPDYPPPRWYLPGTLTAAGHSITRLDGVLHGEKS